MRPLGLSAFIRCKNEEEYIVASITSTYRVFDEIVVILNNSTDRTRDLVQDLMVDYPKIRLLDYSLDCASAGAGYLARVVKEPNGSLAKYYNWCMEQTTFSHVCKWDGDMIALPTFERIRDHIGSNDVVAFDGYDVLGRPTTSLEPRVFRYDPMHTKYEDWELYEVLKHGYQTTYSFEEKCYLHMKLIKKEWLHTHWVSPNDASTRPAPGPGADVAVMQGKSRGAVWLHNQLRRLLRALGG